MSGTKRIPKNGVGKRPASQWYWSDWLRDGGVRACSLEARGLWMDMLAIMHDGQPYGHLTVGGEALNENQLARMVGESPAKVKKVLAELERYNVFSRTEDGTIYSRRMVRDEHIRNIRAEAGKLGGNPNLLDGNKDNHPPNALDKQTGEQNSTPSSAAAAAASSASASSTATTRDLPKSGVGIAGSVSPARDRFFEAFYSRSTADRRADVARQLDQTLKPEGAKLRKGHAVRANSQEHLNRVISEVLRDPPRIADKAITFVLMKLADPELDSAGRTVTEAASAERREEDALLARYGKARETAISLWIRNHPQEAEQIEDHVKRTADNEISRQGVLMRQLVAASGFPEFDTWVQRQKQKGAA